jgi:hypothetical protein
MPADRPRPAVDLSMSPEPQPRLWSPLPNEPQLRLLQFVLSPAFDVAGFAAWSKTIGPQSLDEGSRRLLPSLYTRLKTTGTEHPWLSAAWGMHARSLYRNRLLIQRGLLLVDRLAQSGVSSLLLKGAALGPGYYADLGQRPMVDFDLMVPEATPHCLVEDLLTADGGMQLRERALHAHTYLDRDGLQYDIHWHLLPELAYRGSSRRLWDRAVPLQLEQVSQMTLRAEDHVFHLLAHGLRISDVPPLRWIVDATVVLRARPAFDWRLLVDEARETATAIPVARGLSLLVEQGFAGGGAIDALAQLHALPKRRPDSYLFAGQMRQPSFLYSFFRPVLLYCRLRRLAGVSPVQGFGRFLVVLWDLKHRRQIPGAFLGKLGAKLKGWAALA